VSIGRCRPTRSTRSCAALCPNERDRHDRVERVGRHRRKLNDAFDGITGNRLDFYPAEHRKEIDELNALIYPNVNKRRVPRRLSRPRKRPTRRPPLRYSPRSTSSTRGSPRSVYLTGARDEADWRFFTTLARFDAVYSALQVQPRRIVDYPSLWGLRARPVSDHRA